MSESIWDSPEMKMAAGSDFVKFTEVGQSVTGLVQLVKMHRFDDGTVAPQIFLQLDDGTEKGLTGGAALLKASLFEARPEAGDRLTVTLTAEEPRAGGKSLRRWDVKVDRSGAQPQAPAQQHISPQAAPGQTSQPEPQQPASQQDVAAALANLTPEQRQALGL